MLKNWQETEMERRALNGPYYYKIQKKIFNVFVNIPKNFDKYKVKGNLTYSWKSHQSMFFFVADIFLILWGCWPKKWHLTYFSVSQDYTYESPSISQVQNTHFTIFKVWMKRCKELQKKVQRATGKFCFWQTVWIL